MEKTTGSTAVPSAEAPATSPSPGHAESAALPTIEQFLPSIIHPLLKYTDFSSSIAARPNFNSLLHISQEIFEWIVHPYDTDAFDHMLQKHGLSQCYPLLIDNLCHGFPLGNMPNLTETVIIKNNRSFDEFQDDILDYINKEVVAGRMSGPFSKEDIEQTLCGLFYSSPIIAVSQPQPGLPNKVRVCQHLSKSTRHVNSINSHISKDDFPTRFNTT